MSSVRNDKQNDYVDRVNSVLRDILENDKDWDILIVPSRKTFWEFCHRYHQLGLEKENRFLCSEERLLKKDLDGLTQKKDPVIYILCDAGVPNCFLFFLAKHYWKSATIYSVSCCMTIPKENIFSEIDDVFLESIRYFHNATPSELGMTAYSMENLAYESMVPYNYGLPILMGKDSNTVAIDKKTFSSMKQSDLWTYVEMESSFDTDVSSGFFLYEDSSFLKMFSNRILTAVILCQYKKGKEITAVFQPYIILKSVSFGELWAMFEKIFSHYGKEYYALLNERKKKVDVTYAVQSALKYFFCCYLGKEFAKWTGKYGLYLSVEDPLITEHSCKEFVHAFLEIKEQDSLFFFGTKFSEYHYPIRSIPSSDIPKEDVYVALYFEFLCRERECFLVEDMEFFLKSRVSSYYELKICLTKILLRMLHEGIITPTEKGFRTTDNIHRILPFFNQYLFYAVDLFYRRITWNHDDDDLFDLFYSNIEDVLDHVGIMFRQRDYMGFAVTEQELKYFKKYFTIFKNFSVLIENKRHLLQDENTNEIIYQDIANVVRNFCRKNT